MTQLRCKGSATPYKSTQRGFDSNKKHLAKQINYPFTSAAPLVLGYKITATI